MSGLLAPPTATTRGRSRDAWGHRGSVRVIEVRDVQIGAGAAGEVAAFLAAHPAATAYAQPAWLAAMRRFMGVEAWYQVARRDDRIAGVMPVVERPLHPRAAVLPPLLRPVRRESLGHDCYGGPLLAPGLDDDD